MLSASITRAGIWREVLEFVRLPFPLLRVGRGRFFDRNIWPDFRVFRIQRQPFLKPRLGVRFDRVERAFRLADPAPIKRPFSRSQWRIHSWCPSVLAVLVHWLKMDAQKTYVLWLNRNTQEQAFSGRGARARQVAAHLSAEVRAVLANTEAPMRPTRS